MTIPSLQEIALRNQGVYISDFTAPEDNTYASRLSVLICVHFLSLCGYTLSEEVYKAILRASQHQRETLMRSLKELYGLKLNWAALTRCWDDAIEVTDEEKFLTYALNLFDAVKGIKGTHLSCGHFIPSNTFPLERYTGCPLCGTPFEVADYTYLGQGSQVCELKAYTYEDMEAMLGNLLASSVPLDATQVSSLSGLLRHFSVKLPQRIEVREIAVAVIDYLVEVGRGAEAFAYIETARDILRYLWFRQTGFLQIIEPRVFVGHRLKQQMHYDTWYKAKQERFLVELRHSLKLKYPRSTCRAVAEWLNALPESPQTIAEQMHPKRGMWVRIIRALRLAEYARRRGFERLAGLLDVFYRQDYKVYMGEVEQVRQDKDLPRLAALLAQRPGLFARQLFSTMLAFGAEETLGYFAEVARTMPMRLLFSLYNGAMTYFDKESPRFVKPITGIARQIAKNKYFEQYSQEDLLEMLNALRSMVLAELTRRYRTLTPAIGVHKVYIDPMLHGVPLPVGERSTTVQHVGYALPGTRFAVQGNAVRLFMQWGMDLPAQHLDMDLSCRLLFNDANYEDCAYYHLRVEGAQHSGDMQYIPDFVGTAEYIELDLPTLERRGVRYVVFACNAYSRGALSPNLMFGWMHSKYPMAISKEDGVAYDPSCVAYLCKVGEESLHKGLVFGALDVEAHEVIWLEMPLRGQTLRSLNREAVEAQLKLLERKLRIGELLRLQIEAQGLNLVDRPEDADVVYSYDWALRSGELYKQVFV